MGIPYEYALWMRPEANARASGPIGRGMAGSVNPLVMNKMLKGMYEAGKTLLSVGRAVGPMVAALL